MEQSIPGSQNEPFFELLHPNASQPPHAVDPDPAASQNGSLPADPPPSQSFDMGGEKIEPSFDFQPIRCNSSAKVVDAGPRAEEISSSASKGRPSSASDKYHEPKNFPSSEPARAWDPALKSKEERELNDSVAVAAVERTMKKYADNLLRVLEVMSGRLSKLETTAQGLEHAIEGLKFAEGENHGQTSGRIVRLEQLIKEVQTGVQLLHDRQEVAEAKSQLTKPQQAYDDKATYSGGMTYTPTVDGWQQPKGEVIGHHLVSSQPPQQPAYHPQAPPSSQQLSHHSQAPPPLLQALPAPQQVLSPSISVNIPNEPGTPTIHQQPLPPPQQQHLPPPQPGQAPPYSMQLSSFNPQQPPQHQSSLNPQVEPTAYGVQPHIPHPVPATLATSSYIAEVPQYPQGNYEGPRMLSSPQQPLSSHQQHGPGGPGGHQQMFEPVIGRMGSTPTNLPHPYVQQSQPAPPVSMYETYSAAPYRVAQPVPSAPSGGVGYPRLPTAQPLQHALPASSGSSSGAPHSANRVPIDEVIEKVAGMGFSREQVKTVVRRLSESGQSVDLNIVLDKLMNGGGEFQPPKGWFSR